MFVKKKINVLHLQCNIKVVHKYTLSFKMQLYQCKAKISPAGENHTPPIKLGTKPSECRTAQP